MPKPPTATHDTEVVADPEKDRRRRRNFSTEEKLRILMQTGVAALVSNGPPLVEVHPVHDGPGRGVDDDAWRALGVA
jgi:hypothetical protein